MARNGLLSFRPCLVRGSPRIGDTRLSRRGYVEFARETLRSLRVLEERAAGNRTRESGLCSKAKCRTKYNSLAPLGMYLTTVAASSLYLFIDIDAVVSQARDYPFGFLYRARVFFLLFLFLSHLSSFFLFHTLYAPLAIFPLHRSVQLKLSNFESLDSSRRSPL